MTENENVRERLARVIGGARDRSRAERDVARVSLEEWLADAILAEFPELGRETAGWSTEDRQEAKAETRAVIAEARAMTPMNSCGPCRQMVRKLADALEAALSRAAAPPTASAWNGRAR